MKIGSLKSSLANYNISKGGVLLILLISTLLPFLILSFYNHPSPGDDFFEADVVLQKGFWAAQKYWYLNNSGRFFSTMFLSLTPLVFHAYWACKFNAILFLVFLVITTYWLSGKLFGNVKSNIKIGITSLFVFAFIIRLPGIGEQIFWQSSEYSTFAPEIMTLLLFGSIISYYPFHNKKWYFILSCFLSMAIVASYEICMIFLDFVMVIMVFVKITKKRNLFFPVSLLAACIIFSLIDFLAPGNSTRATDFFPQGHQLFFAVKQAILASTSLLLHWLPFMLFIGVLLFDLFSKIKIADEVTSTIFGIPPVLSLIACMLIPFFDMLILFWTEGEYPPYRTINVILFYFVLGMFYFSFSCIVRIKKRFPDFTLPTLIKLPIYCILVFIIVFRPNNIAVAYKDISSGTAATYNKQLEERNEFLTNFKGDSCVVPTIKNIPKSFIFYELPPDSLCNKPSHGEYPKTVSEYLYVVRTTFDDYYHKKYIGTK